jgi:multidrug efflux pump
VLGHQRLTLAVAGGALVLTVLLYVLIPKGLLPEQDTGLITAWCRPTRTSPSRRWSSAPSRSPKRCGTIRRDRRVGVHRCRQQNPTLNQGQLSIVLKERSQRDGLDEILPRLQKAVAGIPAWRCT